VQLGIAKISMPVMLELFKSTPLFVTILFHFVQFVRHFGM
jgi:hypothetical protein